MSRPQKYRARKHLKEVRSMTHKSPLLGTPLSPSALFPTSALFSLFTTAIRPLIPNITPNDRS